MKPRAFALGFFIVVTGCTAVEAQSVPPKVYWDAPETGSYWVKDGVEVSAIREAASVCGAQVNGGVYHHIPIPPGFAFHGFYFVGENTPEARACTVDRLGAVPQLTSYERREP